MKSERYSGAVSILFGFMQFDPHKNESFWSIEKQIFSFSELEESLRLITEVQAIFRLKSFSHNWRF